MAATGGKSPPRLPSAVSESRVKSGWGGQLSSQDTHSGSLNITGLGTLTLSTVENSHIIFDSQKLSCSQYSQRTGSRHPLPHHPLRYQNPWVGAHNPHAQRHRSVPAVGPPPPDSQPQIKHAVKEGVEKNQRVSGPAQFKPTVSEDQLCWLKLTFSQSLAAWLSTVRKNPRSCLLWPSLYDKLISKDLTVLLHLFQTICCS